MIPRKEPSLFASILAFIVMAVFIVLAFAALPLLALLSGMAIGFILEVFTGDYVVQAFNAVGFSGIKDGDLPKIFGLLALVTMYLSPKLSAIGKRKGDE